MNRFGLKETSLEDGLYLPVNPLQLNDMCFELAKKVNTHLAQNPQERFDRLLVLANGAWTIGRTIKDQIGIPEASSIHISSYIGTQKLQEPIIRQGLPQEINIKGENILVADDLADSGDTIRVALRYVRGKKAALSQVATIFYKPKFSSVLPDYFVGETDAWVIFHHEIREFVKEKAKKLFERGMNRDEVLGWFGSIEGLDMEKVEHFVGLPTLDILAG